VLLAFVVPARAIGPFEHRWRPVSAGVAVPVFAFFAAGVSVAGAGGVADILRDPVTIGIVAGLVVGKAVGIAAAAWLVQRFTRAELDEGLSWWDVLGLALLGGIGFTVALLLAELAFGAGTVRDAHAKAGVLIGSVLAALLATVVLRIRSRVYRRGAA
jgi:NhaA family Na+:H+ antiporter